MNALLRIQVRLLAKEANADLQKMANAIAAINRAQSGRSTASSTSRLSAGLKDISAEFNKIQNSMSTMSSSRSFTNAAKDAEAYQAKLDAINRSLSDINKVKSGKNNQYSADADQVVNLKEGRAAAQAAVKEAEALANAQAKAQQRAAREGAAAVQASQRQAAQAAKLSAKEQAAAEREAAAQQREIERSQNNYLKQMWKEQTTAKKLQQKEETDAVKQALKEQKEAAKSAAAATKSTGTGSTGLTSADTNQLSLFGRVSQKINGDINTTRKGLIGMGKDLQWVGRQINFNFTLPLLYAGKQALDFVLANEKAFTRLQKVYSGAADDLKPIKEGLRALSDYYGVTQSEVINLGEAWAAAGAKGGDLLASVEASIQLATLGDYTNLTDTFNDLIVIQKAYGLSTQGLALAVAKLNTVENATAATLQDLVTGVALVGSSARVAGIDLDHLAAFMAVLTPATGSASRAANSFKTIIAQLTAPTDKVVSTLKDMGIDFYSTSFQMQNAGDRLKTIAAKFTTLTDAQQAYVARTLGSLWGINKFSALMQDLNSRTSEYASTLELLGKANEKNNLAQAAAEIQVLLNSDPQKFQKLMTMLQNMAADVILPLLPSLIGILTLIRNLAQWFSNLSPQVQRAAIGILILVSAIGILAQMIGSVELLVGTFGKFILFLIGLLPGVGTVAAGAMTEVAAAGAAGTAALATEAAAATGIVAAEASAVVGAVALASEAEVAAVTTAGAAMLAETTAVEGAMATAAVAASGPVGWAAAAIVAALVAAAVLIIIHWDKVKAAFKASVRFIADGMAALPRIVANAFTAVVRVLASAAKAVIHWLSYLNPFARHSPSLVDNVTAGVQVILDQYSRLRNIGAIFSDAAGHLKEFAAATQAAIDAANQSDRSQQTTDVLTVSPGAAAPLANLYADMDELQPHANLLNAAIKEQEKVVAAAKKAYDEASRAVDAFDKSLDPLRKHVEDLKKQIDDANQIISNLGNTQITGMQAYTDAIFDNEMAQKKLRLEILKLGQAGQTYEQLQAKMAAINGEIEMLQGKIGDLRAAGAGSDILSVYQDQVDSLEAQKNGLADSAKSAKDLEDELAKLQTQGEILDLEKSLNFDPLLKQIQDLINGTKEMSFADIIAGITEQQGKVKELTTDYEASNAELEKQTQVLDAMKAARDVLKDSYDAEQASLDALKETYQAIIDKLQEIKDAIAAVVEAKKTLEPAAGSGGAGAGGGDFGDLSGDYTPDPTVYQDPKRALQSAEDWLKEFQDRVGDMFKDFNPFKWFTSAWKWVRGIITDAWNWVKEKAVDLGGWFADLPGKLWDWLQSGISSAGAIGLALIDWLWDGIQSAAPKIANFFIEMPGKIVGWTIDAIQYVFELGADIIDGLVRGLIEYGPTVAAWFLLLPVHILEWIVGAAEWLVGPGSDMLGGFLLGVINKAIELGEWFIGMAPRVVGWIGNVALTLWSKGVDVLAGMLGGMKDKAQELFTWIGALPGRVLEWLGEIANLLYERGSGIISGFWQGAKDKLNEVATWVSGIAGQVFSWIGGVSLTLWSKGSDFIVGLLNGMYQKIQEVITWLTELPGRVIGWIGDVVSSLWQTGVDFIAGLLNGILAKVLSVVVWFLGLPELVINSIPNPLGMLYDVGKKILQGLWDGMKSIWNSVTNWLSGLNPANWFNDINVEKGHADINMLPAGLKTVEGLQRGMKQGWEETQRWLKTLDPGALLATNLEATYSIGKDAMAPLQGFSQTVQPMNQTIDNSRHVTITIADVSFPGITSSDDADTFLSNLEAMAGT